jgi:nicotinamidase-related amidase
MLPVGVFPRNAWRAEPGRVDLRRAQLPPRPVELACVPQRVVLDLARTACIVVDMQNDFCSPGGWLASIGVDVASTRQPIDRLERLLPALRAGGVPILWLNWGARPDRANLPPGVLHVYDPDGRHAGIGDPLPPSGSRVLERGSWGAQVVEELVIDSSDVCIDKYRMSGFFDTELDGVLRNLAVTTLLFAGVNVDQCVLATLTDAACLGYDCLLLEDCSATNSPAYCLEATLYNVRQCFGFVASSEDLLGALRVTTGGDPVMPADPVVPAEAGSETA